MNRPPLMRASLILALLLATPQVLAADDWPWVNETCGGSTLQACVGFMLNVVGSGTDGEGNQYWEYSFTVEYLSTLQTYEPNQGVITAGGIYDPDGAPDFDFYDVTLTYVSTGGGWGAYAGGSDCQQLSGAGTTLIEGCAGTDSGVNYGLGLGDMVTFTFKSNYQFDLATVGEELGARAHFQSYGSEDCSFKLDSRLGVVSPPDGGIDGCGNVVPEPVTVLLLGTGLLGVGAVGYIRRRREDEEEV